MDKRLFIAFGIFGTAAVAALVSQPSHREQTPLPASSPSAPAHAPASSLVVYVAGAVRTPGVYGVPAGSRAVAAVKAAGGATAAADLAGVNLAERLDDGEEILVPDRDEGMRSRPGRRAGRRPRRSHGKRRHKAPAQAPASEVDLNRAGVDALSSVPGIGDSLAARIVAFRESNGPFDELTDLLDVGGMSQGRLDRAASYLRIR